MNKLYNRKITMGGHYISKIFFVFIMLLISYASSSSPKIVLNLDFESIKLSKEGIPLGFKMWGPNEDKKNSYYTYDSNNPPNGRFSIRIHQPKDSKGYLTLDEGFAIKVEPSMTYTISFWAKSNLDTRKSYDENKQLKSFVRITPYSKINLPRIKLDRKAEPLNDLSNQWKKYEFKITEGVEFNVKDYPYLMFDFIAAPYWIERMTNKTLWLDDITVTASVTGREKDLAFLNFPKPSISYSLEEGPLLSFTVDAFAQKGEVNKKISGISFHMLTSGPTKSPFDLNGKYNLTEVTEKNIRELKLPLTRVYGLSTNTYGKDVLYYDLEGAIDRMAELSVKLQIPQENIVLEFLGPRDQQQHKIPLLSPEEWAKGVKYSITKNYSFKYWEIGNEVYTDKYSDVFDGPDKYIEYFKSVSANIKKIQPQGLVGISIANNNSLEWREKILKEAKGFYDFVVPHYYNFGNPYEKTFEEIVISENSRTLENILIINEIIKTFNPLRNVSQFDTEWGLHGKPEGTKNHAELFHRNGNIYGTLHRLARMIYYASGQFVEGATSWVMLGRREANMGLSVIPIYAPTKNTMLYWSYYYLNRFLGDKLLQINGTSPYYQSNKEDLKKYNSPLVPVLATISDDGLSLYIVMVNGSWDKDIPCIINIENYLWYTAEGVTLMNDDPDAHPVLNIKDDLIKKFTLEPKKDNKLNFILQKHSALFMVFRKR